MSNNSQVQTNSVATTQKGYGGWTPLREKVLVESKIEHRPLEKKKLQVAEANAKVKAAVNAVDIGVKPINSWAVFQKKLDTLIGRVKEKEKYDTNYGGGSNDSETHQENRLLGLIQLIDSAKEAQEVERSALLKKKRDQDAIVKASSKASNKLGSEQKTS